MLGVRVSVNDISDSGEGGVILHTAMGFCPTHAASVLRRSVLPAVPVVSSPLATPLPSPLG